MAEKLRTVSIGEMIVSDSPDDVLVAYGLGSCVAVCLSDPVIQVGGMLHALLPTAPNGRAAGNLAKFVDQGVPLMIESILKMGARRSRLVAHLCGGSQMLTAPGFDDALNIGKRNVLAAELALQTAGLRIRAQDTGGNSGRTVKLYVGNAQLAVKTLGRGEAFLV